jgi:hypothetical protein
MSNKKDIHTVPSGDRWAVKREGTKTPLSTHRTKTAAEEQGIKTAKKDQVDHVIHGRDGRIQDSDSYGSDPNPPKDKKH